MTEPADQSDPMVPPGANPNYLDWTRVGRGSGWRYLSGTLLILLLWFIGQSIIVIAGILLLGGSFSPDGQIAIPLPWGELFVSLVSFIPFFFATPLVVRFVHKRPALTVVTPFLRLNPRMIVIGAAMWSITLVVLTVPTVVLRGEDIRWNFQPDLFFPALVIAVVVLIFQTTAEELFFRGYLIQWFAKATRNTWLLALGSGLLFALPHLANPEVAGVSGAGYLVALLVYLPIGVALAVASVRSGTVELAIGAHFANNFFNVVLLTGQGSALGEPSLWVDTAPGLTEAAVGAVVAAAIFIGLTWRMKGSGNVRPLPVVQPVNGGAALPPSPAAPPAGWFPDPIGQARYRYWDGQHWTEHTG